MKRFELMLFYMRRFPTTAFRALSTAPADLRAADLGRLLADHSVSEQGGNTVHHPALSRREAAHALRGLEPRGMRSKAAHRWRRRAALTVLRVFAERFRGAEQERLAAPGQRLLVVDDDGPHRLRPPGRDVEAARDATLYRWSPATWDSTA